MTNILHDTDSSANCYNSTFSTTSQPINRNVDSDSIAIPFSLFSSSKNSVMNTRFKHVSTAMVLAVVFNLTSASLQAQTRDSDVSASERVTQVSDSKVNAKPSVSFAESVKKKVAAQSAVKSTTVAPSSAPKVVSQPAVKSAPVARTWDKQTKSAAPGTSLSPNKSVGKDTESKLTKLSAASQPSTTPSKPVQPVTNVINSTPKVLEYQPDASLSDEENEKARARFNKAREASLSSPNSKVVPAGSTPATNSERISPAQKVKVETQPKRSGAIQITGIQEQAEQKGVLENEKLK